MFSTLKTGLGAWETWHSSILYSLHVLYLCFSGSLKIWEFSVANCVCWFWYFNGVTSTLNVEGVRLSLVTNFTLCQHVATILWFREFFQYDLNPNVFLDVIDNIIGKLSPKKCFSIEISKFFTMVFPLSSNSLHRFAHQWSGLEPLGGGSPLVTLSSVNFN